MKRTTGFAGLITNHRSRRGADAAITAGGHSITLEDVHAAGLAAGHFVF
ncbi:MAG: hypothetical protein AAFW98_01470 [Pseudomonadota bacterium]